MTKVRPMSEDNPRESPFISPITGGALTRDATAYRDQAGNRFPIIEGVPRFVQSDGYAQAFGIQWKAFRKTQLDSYTGTHLSEQRLKRILRGELARLQGKRVLEAGSGAGRFTEVLLKHGALLHSFDLSLAVEANFLNNGANQNLVLAQANILNPPFPPASYDVVVCLGVVQHTPSPERTIASLYRMVRPGGILVFDHYVFRFRYWTIAEPYYRALIKRLPVARQRWTTDMLTRMFFPVHWHFKDSIWVQRLLRRVSPVHFYYPHYGLPDREAYFEWARLDTHDGTTDYYKHHRTERQIEVILAKLGAVDIHLAEERALGNGVEAFARRPLEHS